MRVGIIGCGWAGKQHAEVYNNINGINVVAVADENKSLAVNLARQYKIDKVYESYKDLLTSERLDIIDICTPISTHKTVLLDSLNYAPNFLIEKPMARTVDECDEMIEAANEANANVCICHNRLEFPEIVNLKNTLKTVDPGTLVVKTIINLAGAPKMHWKAREEEGGMLWEEGAHAAYLLQYILPEIREIRAHGKKNSYSVYDEVRAYFNCVGNAVGILEIAWNRLPELYLEVFSLEHPLLKIDLDYRPTFTVKSQSSLGFVKTATKQLCKHIQPALKERFFSKGKKIPISYHYEFISKFIKSIQMNEKPPVTLEDGKSAIKLLTEIEDILN